ncbi:MAG: DUF1287 domain-containing protein [Candidatus Hydromicrobium sp.]
MEERIRKKQYRKSVNYKYFIYIVGLIALLQLLTLRACYQEKIFKLPEKLFSSKIDFPISELTLDITYGESESRSMEDGDASVTEEDSAIESDENQSAEIEGQNLTGTPRNIFLKALELLDEDIKYGYHVYDTGYPNDNVWISTDVISFTLRDCGFDLMELIYKDMSEYKEAYSIEDIRGRKTPIEYIDFRDVIFQEKFFQRKWLTELPLEYDKENENNNILWQAGDIVYFQVDENNRNNDLGGIISSHTNDDGVPLVIMISSELGKVREVDKLLEYKIVGHFRYPPPEVD